VARANGSLGLHADLLDKLGRLIVDGELAEGQVLRTEELEARFDVSRTVTREVELGGRTLRPGDRCGSAGTGQADAAGRWLGAKAAAWPGDAGWTGRRRGCGRRGARRST